MLARLIGGPIAAPSVKEIGEKFGLMTLLRRGGLDSGRRY